MTKLKNIGDYDILPEYKKGDIYFIDRRISYFYSYKELPQNYKIETIKRAQDWFYVNGYGNGNITTALILDDFIFKKERLIYVYLTNSKSQTFKRYIRHYIFFKVTTKNIPKTKKKK